VFSNIGGTGLAPSSLSSLLSSLVFLSPSLGIMSGRIKANEKVHYIASTTFTIDRTYSDLKLIGKGSYGIVCSANDHTNNTKVAIKKITPMAKDLLDAKHVLREIRLMRHMGKHENIISLINLMVREAADELYIVMELLDSDLHRVLQSPQILTQSHFRFFLFQLLCGVKYLHDNRIIHRYRHLCLSLSLSRSLSGSLWLSRSFSLSLSLSLSLFVSTVSVSLCLWRYLDFSLSASLSLSLLTSPSLTCQGSEARESFGLSRLQIKNH
jgi:hypothetical protein